MFLQNPSPLSSLFFLSLSLFQNTLEIMQSAFTGGVRLILHQGREINRQHHEQPPFSAPIPPIPTPQAIHGPHHFPDHSPNPNSKEPNHPHRKTDARRVSIPSAAKIGFWVVSFCWEKLIDFNLIVILENDVSVIYWTDNIWADKKLCSTFLSLLLT